MKILLLNYEWPPLGGGGGRVASDLAKQLSTKDKCFFDVVTSRFSDLSYFEKLSNNIKVFRVWSGRKDRAIGKTWEMAFYLWFGFWQSRKLIKQNNYNLAHCHFLIPTGILALIIKRLYKLPFVVTVHGSDVPGYNPDRFKLLHKVLKPIVLAVIKWADKIVCPSLFIKNLILEQLGDFDSKIVVIPNGINTDIILPANKEKIIMSSGRLLPRKGFQYLVKAFQNFDSDYILHIFGSGPTEDELMRLANGDKRIVFHGWVDNKSEEYTSILKSASVFVLYSEKENASLALLEAMSAGCALVVAAGGGSEELVKSCGLVIPGQNSQELEKTLRELFDNEEKIKVLGSQSIYRVQNEYDIKIIGDKYWQVFESYLAVK